MVREKSRTSLEEVWQAIQALPKKDRHVVIDRLLAQDADAIQEIFDAAMARDRRGQTSRPLEEFAEELRREGRL